MKFNEKIVTGSFTIYFDPPKDIKAPMNIYIEKFHDGELVKGKRFSVAREVWYDEAFKKAIRQDWFVRDRIFNLKNESCITEIEVDVRIKHEIKLPETKIFTSGATDTEEGPGWFYEPIIGTYTPKEEEKPKLKLKLKLKPYTTNLDEILTLKWKHNSKPLCRRIPVMWDHHDMKPDELFIVGRGNGKTFTLLGYQLKQAGFSPEQIEEILYGSKEEEES